MKEAEKQVADIKESVKMEAEAESKRILEKGKEEGENIRKILVSKANQDARKELMNAREKIIEECFTKAHHKLSVLNEKEYRETVARFLEEGVRKLGKDCTVAVSREIDKELAKDMGLKVKGSVEVSGGVIITSGDGRVTLDNTFEGILKRKRDELRVKVGKMLFSKV